MKPEEFINRRYHLQEMLGAGSMGVVYRATDRLTGDTLALKRVTAPFVDAGMQQKNTLFVALANEFKSLASLRHPNIMPVRDYGFNAHEPFFTMRYIEDARHLTTAARSASFEQKLDYILQMLHALDYLHRRGTLHRDLKPENALVDVDDRLTLLDFGLAIEVQNAVDDARIAGTLSYIAPEALQQRALTPACDLYAVGMLAYEVLAGRHAFAGVTPAQLPVMVLQVVPDVRALDVDEGLQAIIGRLLAKDPQARYTDAMDVIEAIRRVTGIEGSGATIDLRDSYLHAAQFIGRDEEFNTLRQALSAAKDNTGSAWLVGGQSGVGKSRLLDELRIQALVEGVLVLAGQGIENGGVPYQLWVNPIRRLALEADVDDLDAAILTSIVSDLGELLGRDLPEAPRIDESLLQQRLIGAILTLFRTFNKPVLLLLEDIHWMHESLDVLKALNQIVPELPLLIVATYRTEERHDLPQHLPQMQAMMLDTLSDGEVAVLSESMLGEAGKEEHVLELLQKETEGNVLFLIETVRALADVAGGLQQVWRITLPPSVFAGGVMAVIERRLAHISAEARALLEIAAVNGRQIDIALMNKLVPDADIESWLTDCVNAVLLSSQDDRIRFAHDKVREAVLHSLTDERRKEVSRMIATAIEDLYAEDDKYAAQLAQLWHNVDDPIKEAHYAQQAARQAWFAAQNHEALRYLQRALTLLPPVHADVANVLIELGRVRIDRGEFDRARQHYTRSLQLASERNHHELMALARLGLGDVSERESEYPTALGYYEAALTLANILDDEAIIALAHNRIGHVQVFIGKFDEARHNLQKSQAIAQRIHDSVTIAQNYADFGILHYRIGEVVQTREYFEKSLNLRRASGNRHGIAAALNNLGLVASDQGDHASALNYHRESYNLKEMMGDRYGMGNSLQSMGIAHMGLGAHAEAQAHFKQALDVARELGDQMGIADNLNNLGLVMRRQGDDLAQAKRYLQEAVELARSIGDAVGEALARSNLGDILLRMGETDNGRYELRRALKQGHDLPAMQPVLRSMLWLSRLLLTEGDQRQQAAEIWHFVQGHESCDAETRHDAEREIAAILDGLSEQERMDALVNSEALDLDDTVALLLNI